MPRGIAASRSTATARPTRETKPGVIAAEDLERGEIEVLGRLPWASNYSLLGRVVGPAREEMLVVYKPRRGEAPLWDFPPGTLCRREVAAFLVSEAAGWDFVPPTTLRDGPLGEGAVQVFIDHDPSVTAFHLLETRREDLRRVALFDLAVNNADRKAGHVFVDESGHMWAVDHGICFHAEPKIRTVLWDFVGEPFSEPEQSALESLARALDADLAARLEGLLDEGEIEALRARVRRFLSEQVFPEPGPGRPYPWPPV